MKKVMHMLHSLDANVGDLASTVRYGTKWENTHGADLILCVCSAPCEEDKRESCNDPDGEPCINCTRQGTGKVTTTWVGKFSDIPARLIAYEHEVRSREYPGLLASMNKAYGSWTDFDENSTVVIVLYERLT